ncbi:hypothetical protein C8J56DRAFT_897985 [Mycena floridula]|nr:hypothetical protein C8J56DRAFT_897985 [Mycena floridula]
MAYRPFYIAHKKQHGQPPLQSQLYCRLLDIAETSRSPDDTTWRLAVCPPVTMGIARHYWNVIKKTFYPNHEFHPTHPRPPVIFAEFNQDPKQFVDVENWVSIDFGEFEHMADGLVIYPNLIVANQGNDIHVVNSRRPGRPGSATSLVFDSIADEQTRASIQAQTDWLSASFQGYIPAVREGQSKEYFLDKAFQFYQVFPGLAPAMDTGTDLDREPDIHETLQWMQQFLFLFWGNDLAAANVSAVRCLEAITEFPLDTVSCPLTGCYRQFLVFANPSVTRKHSLICDDRVNLVTLLLDDNLWDYHHTVAIPGKVSVTEEHKHGSIRQGLRNQRVHQKILLKQKSQEMTHQSINREPGINNWQILQQDMQGTACDTSDNLPEHVLDHNTSLCRSYDH